MNEKIVVIITGGIINEEYNQELRCYVPKEVSNNINITEAIKNDVDLNLLEFVNFAIIDSCTIDIEFLYELAKLIQRKINSDYVKGIIEGCKFLFF